MESPSPRHRAPTRIWIRLAIGAAIVVGFLLLTFAAVIVSGGVKESRAIEAVRARGDPLSPAEIPFPSTEVKSDLHERLEEFGDVYADAPEFRYIDLSSRDEFLAEVRAADAWAGAVQPLEDLFACAGDDVVELGPWMEAVEAKLAHPRHVRGVAPCERQLIGARAALAQPVLELASDACRASPETAERLLREWSVADGLNPGSERHRVVLIGHAVRVLSDTAIALALEGRAEEACEMVGLAFRGANLVRDWPWLLGHFVWQYAMERALEGLKVTLASLPADVDLSAIEKELVAVDVEAQFRRALIGDRAIGNEMFDALRDGRLTGLDGTTPIPIYGISDLFVWSWLGHDRAFYLDTMTLGVEWAQRPYFEVVHEMAAYQEEINGSLMDRFALASPLLIPRIDKSLEAVGEMRARIGLARIAILAKRDGSEAGLRAAADLPDPFGPGPLQARIEPDGTLVLWSIGTDLKNEGGEGGSLDEEGHYDEGRKPTDIVWYVGPR